MVIYTDARASLSGEANERSTVHSPYNDPGSMRWHSAPCHAWTNCHFLNVMCALQSTGQSHSGPDNRTRSLYMTPYML